MNPSRHKTRVGADVGTSLVKLAIRSGGEPLRLELEPSEAIERVARKVESLGPERIGLTGGGAPRLAALLALLGLDTTGVGEFDAWSVGARTLLREQGVPEAGPFLLVSLGTGTSVLRVEGEQATRVGGTPLGGGTLLGLGAALTGRTRFEELVELAGAGDRSRVDLLVSDVYPQGLAELPGAANAASFGKLARLARAGERPDPRDLVDALMALVGENVALLCNEIAGREQLRRIVFGGSALAGNPSLARWLVGLTRALGREPVLLTHSAHPGAVGALVVAEQ